MRVSLNWLREFLPDLGANAAELESVFASLGMQAESVEKLALGFSGVVVGRVEEVWDHPNADRLRLCRVTSGSETQEVVCGAWNFSSGAVIPWARPGASLADGSEVAAVAIRGVESHGMICSESELGLGEEADGILVLDGGFAVGSDFGASLPFPDVVFDLEIESNRSDELAMLGVAREVAAHFELDLVVPRVGLDPEVSEHAANVSIEDPEGCGRFVAIPITGVEVGPAPLWMRLRLQAAGMRPINNVVDVTNYVMLELGQPLHAFDLDRVVSQSLTVRRAAGGETLVTLDGIDRTLSAEDLVIADGEGITSIAGVIGGERSEVQDDTTRVLLEAAHWHPPTIMGMSIRHAFRTEASARFSGGVDPNLPPIAARRAAELLVEAGAGQEPEAMLDLVTRPIDPWAVDLPLSDIPRLLGAEIDRDRTVGILGRLYMTVEGDDPLSVTVPTWRPDVTRSADLVEEVARHYGYNEFPETLPRGSGSGLTPAQLRVRRVRSTLMGAGFSEAQTFSFMSPGDLDRLGLPEGHPARRLVEIRNPISETEGVLRSTILPGLLRSASRNVALGTSDAALFEVGRVFTAEPWEFDERIPTQPVTLAFVALGAMGATGLGETPGLVDIWTATGVWEMLTAAMRVRGSLRGESVAGLHPGRSAVASAADVDIGFVGELHPAAARAFDLPGRVAVGEFLLSPFLTDAGAWTFNEPSLFPPVVFDLAFEVDADLPSSRLLSEIEGSAGPELESADLFDEFTGPPLAEGSKSLAFRVVIRAPDRTLTQEEVRPVRQRIVDAVSSQLDAKLRGDL